MAGPTPSQQKILAASRGDSASMLEVLQSLAQTTTQQQTATGTTPVASVTPGQPNPAAPVPPQATGSVSLLSSNYIVQIVNPGAANPISTLQAQEARGNFNPLTPVQPVQTVFHQIRASTSPAFNVNSNTQTFGGNTGSSQVYWTITGLGSGRWYFQFRSTYDGINFNQWKNANGGNAIGSTVESVTVQSVTGGIFGSFNLPGGQLAAVGVGYVPDQGTFGLPGNLYSSAMLAVAGPNGFVDNGHTVSTISTCAVDVAVPVAPEPISGPPDYPVVVTMEYEDNGGNINPGKANWLAFAFDPLGPNVKQVQVTGGNWVIFRMPGGWDLAVGNGSLASGGTIPMPPGFNAANMLAIPAPNGYTMSGHQAAGIKNGSVSAAGLFTMEYGDNSSNVWTSTGNWFAVAWTPGIATVGTTGGKWLVFNGPNGSKLAFGAGVIAGGASFALPAGFTSSQLFSFATPNSYNSTSNVMHGVFQCFIDVLQATLTYQDGSGNSWSGDVNWMAFAWMDAAPVTPPQPPAPNSIVAPAIPGKTLSPMFSVTADTLVAPCYTVGTGRLIDPSTGVTWPADAEFGTASYCSFQRTGPVALKVTYPTAITSAIVQPASAGITATFAGNVATFIIPNPGKYSLELNGDSLNNLFINANPVATPPSAGAGVTILPLGTTAVSAVSLFAGQKYYIPDGAQALLDATAATAFTLNGAGAMLYGQGIIDCINRPAHHTAVNLNACTDAVVDGLIIVNNQGFNVTVTKGSGSQITNNMIVDKTINGDGIDVFDSNNFTISGNLIQVCDDCVSVKSIPGGSGVNTGLVENNIISNCLAHGLCVGWETDQNITAVVFQNNDIIHDFGRTTLFAVNSDDPGAISDISFIGNRIQEAQWPVSVSIFVDADNVNDGIGPGTVSTTLFQNNAWPTPLRAADPPWEDFSPGYPWVLHGYGASNEVVDTTFDSETIDGAAMVIGDIQIDPYVTGTVVTP